MGRTRHKRERTHGATLVEVLITIAIIALGGIAAMRTVANAIGSKATQTGEAIATLSPFGAQPGAATPPATGVAPQVPPVPTPPVIVEVEPDDDDGFDLPFGIPTPPIVPMSKEAAFHAIKAGDRTQGHNLLDTPFEDEMLRRWLEGSGDTYELTPDELALIQNSPKAQEYGDWVRQNGRNLGDGEVVKPGFDDGATSVERVILEDGRVGYRVSGTFNDDNTAPGDPLDGAFGKANVYYDENGNVVGITDTYDFSNAGAAVKAVNAMGAAAGAKNFAVRGGVIARDPRPEEVTAPDGPTVQDDIAGEMVEEGGERLGPIIDRAEDIVDPLLPGGDVSPPDIFGPFLP